MRWWFLSSFRSVKVQMSRKLFGAAEQFSCLSPLVCGILPRYVGLEVLLQSSCAYFLILIMGLKPMPFWVLARSFWNVEISGSHGQGHGLADWSTQSKECPVKFEDLSSKKPTHVDIKQLAPLTRSAGVGVGCCLPQLGHQSTCILRGHRPQRWGSPKWGRRSLKRREKSGWELLVDSFGIRIISMLSNFHVYSIHTTSSIKQY